jgi:DMATS type aromatic prenyltransferase
MLKSPMRDDAPQFRPGALVEGHSSGQMPRARSVFVDRLTGRLLQLCAATELNAATTELAERVFRDLIVPWSRVEAFSEHPNGGWISEISDDNTPIEFSVTLSPAGSEVRVLFEPQGDGPTLAAHREAALSMHEELASQYGADLSRFRQVEDLFTPVGMHGPFALWSAVVFSNDKPASFKAYFNPQAQGPGSAVALVEEGLRRVGLPRAWRHLAATLARRGPHRDELKYFALDLSESSQARVKVYVRHHDATPEDLQIAATAAPGSTRGEAEDFARAMGGGARRFKDRATFTCAAFVGGDDDRPSATTQYVPVCAYALDDLEVEQRVGAYLTSQQMDATPYLRLLSSFANRPLNAGVGMQSWVAFRRYRGVPRLTVYLGSETRCVFAPGTVPAGTLEHISFESPQAVLACVARYPLERHPCVEIAGRLAGNGKLLWLLVNNTSELLTNTTGVECALFREWLEQRSSVARTLSDEELACRHLFAEAVTAAGSSDPTGATAASLAALQAARSLASYVAAMLEEEDPDTSVRTIDSALRPVPVSASESALLERLELSGEHALPAVVRGALNMHEQLWVALDRLADLAPADTGDA